MVRIRPFMGYRPQKSLVKNVAALPYDIVSQEDAKRLVRDNPHSFLNIDRYEMHLQEGARKEIVYQGARKYLEKLIEENIFELDNNESIYIYKMESSYGIHHGIIACLYCDDYKLGNIKCHEKIRQNKKRDRITYIQCCNYQTAPIVVIHNKNIMINEWIYKNSIDERLEYSFRDELDVVHKIFKVTDREDIEYLTSIFEKIENLYLADGHHRTECLAEYADIKREKNIKHNINKGYNYLLSAIFSSDQLVIQSYNRVIKDKSGLKAAEIMSELEKKFIVAHVDKEIYIPDKKYIIGMRYQKKWYRLELRKEQKERLEKFEALDVNILHEFILKPIFRINDSTKDNDIEFIEGNGREKMLNTKTEDDKSVAFSLFPTQINEFMNIVNNDKLMPPKSTWFEPRINRGLFIHKQD